VEENLKPVTGEDSHVPKTPLSNTEDMPSFVCVSFTRYNSSSSILPQ
jgi:hypothetical protein